MNARIVRSALILLGLSVLAGLTFAVAATAAAESPAACWLPRPATPERISPIPEVYFEGLSGFIVGIASPEGSTLAEAGGSILDLKAGETLFVYLLEDALRADFLPPTRVLVRAGHEVVVATNGEAPRLTSEADQALAGLKQPVRVDLVPRFVAEIGPAETLPPAVRDADPFVQGMVDQVTNSTYVSKWQPLDDFETREVFQPNNAAASQWILAQFQSYGLAAQFHYYNQSGQKRNVVATLPGQVDPTKVIYICSHFDATSPTPVTCAPGADDNGTGTVAVLEAARILSQYLFQYTIKFACFNGEEQGLVGSGAYATDMDTANEDIIAVYDCDMIGYRGTDPAPADLVIYTNTASQSLATILSNAATTYTPGQLQPIVIVSTLEASDYAPFWQHGWHAICSIEDEAWGDDFCPWYHTCNDRIERYPIDYAVSCTKANLAAVALTALPINPQTSFLVLASSTLDDDAAGGSSGNDDGIANPGETIELWATVRNVGAQTATGVTGTLTTTTPGVTILTATAHWADIPSGQERTNTTALRFQLASSVADGTMLDFTLTMTDASGSRPLSLQYPVAAPKLAHYWHKMVDLSSGNGNGVADPGEVIVVPVTLSNRGSQGAVSVTAVAASGSPHLSVIDGTATAASIPSGGSADLAPGFRLVVSGDAVVGEILPVTLTVSTAGGYQTTTSFRLKVATAIYDDCEAEAPWTLATAGDNATSGLWVRGDPVGTIYNSAQCQPEDDHTATPYTDCYVTGQGSVGGAAGDADVDGGKTTLTSPLLDLSHVTDPRITYWRWYTNNLGNNPNQDYWVVQVSGDGGTVWIDLENSTASANSWTEKSFLISDYLVPTSQMRVRFIANDVSPNSLLEAAVDDFEISGPSTSVGVEDNLPVASLRLDAPRPSPSASGTRISFALPEARPASLQIFAIDGRLVRTLARGPQVAGEHLVTWDGRDGAGQTVAPGVYFVRLEAGDPVLSRRMVVAP